MLDVFADQDARYSRLGYQCYIFNLFEHARIKAMSDAAALFAESVRLNNFERVRVLPRALAAEPGRGVDMTYESGAESGLGSRRAA